MRRRTILYVLLALAVPLPALALAGGGSGSPSLSVSASLDSCGIAADRVVCKIDASWNPVPGATRYTARVTSPDGSVADYGDVGAGGTSFWVPYVGNGTYTVTVAVYGSEPTTGERELLEKSTSGADGRSGTRAAVAVGGPIGPAEEPTNDPSAGEPGSDPMDPTDPICEDDPTEDPPEESTQEPAGPASEQELAQDTDAEGASPGAEEAEPAEPECEAPSPAP
jgi:hypothetical protein